MSSIVFCQPTVIDHAYITPSGRIQGGSFNPDFVATGALREREEVVADFSFAKKMIKQIVDDAAVGYDHKLWLHIGFSKAEIEIVEGSVEQVLAHRDIGLDQEVWFSANLEDVAAFESENGKKLLPDGDAILKWQLLNHVQGTLDTIGKPEFCVPLYSIIVRTPSTELVLPLDAVKFVEGEYTANDIAKDMDRHLTSAFHSYYKHGKEFELAYDIPDITIETTIRSEPHTFINPTVNQPELVSIFRYSHGLGRSSSWGCQNAAHGHKSFIQFILSPDADIDDASNLIEAMVSELDGALFVAEQDVVNNDLNEITVKYKSDSRGMFFAKYNKTEYPNIYVLDSETTVEQIARHVYLTEQHELEAVFVEKMVISEGLNKGCVITV